MRKLRLDVNALNVVSFQATATDDGTGTVQGHFVPTNPWCAANTYKSYCPDSLCTCPPPTE